MNSKGPKPASAERRLSELGIELTPAPIPFGAYVESVQTGNLLYLSGVLPAIGHEPKFVGRLGREYNVEQGREAAHVAALNVLAAARNHLGSLDKVTRMIRLVVYLATEGDFFADKDVCSIVLEMPNPSPGPVGIWARTVDGASGSWVKADRGARPDRGRHTRQRFS